VERNKSDRKVAQRILKVILKSKEKKWGTKESDTNNWCKKKEKGQKKGDDHAGTQWSAICYGKGEKMHK